MTMTERPPEPIEASPPAKPLTLWVVYDKPSDFPSQFVARKWLNEKPTDVVITGTTLDHLRSNLPAGLFRIDRDESDEPQIVETWI